MPSFSIVSTLYKSSGTCEQFLTRVLESTKRLTNSFEIIIVDDGCPEKSGDLLIQSFSNQSLAVRIVKLSKNFGHHHAMMTGLSLCQGEYIFLIDSDLEEPPELIGSFYEKLITSNADVIYGVQNTRKGDFFERVTGSIFYNFYNMLCSNTLPKNVSVVRLMKRKYVDALLRMQERNLFMAGAWSYIGFHQLPYIFRKGSRNKSTYSLNKKINQLISAIISYSAKPLDLIALIGSAVVLLGILLLVWLTLSYLIQGDTPPGFMMIICTQLLGFGILLIFQGIIAQYTKVIFFEIKSRPTDIVREDTWLS